VPHQLEAPITANDLYRARGDEVETCRPYFTGDVFADVETRLAGCDSKLRYVQIVEYPCDLRTNGVDLVPQLLVANVQPHRVLEAGDWNGYGKFMPLPNLRPDASSDKKRHFAAAFGTLFLVTPEQLGSNRIACLSQAGVNLLHQRLVYRASRVVIPTVTYDEANSGVFEEADLIEEWCLDRVDRGLDAAEAAAECVTWLREKRDDGLIRQQLLRDPQQRSTIRRQMKGRLRELRTAELKQ
jgi:hypothetical protein